METDQLVMVRLGRLAELTNRATDSGIGIPYALRRTELRVVRAIDSHPEPQGVVDLARLCGVDKAGISRAVQHLIEEDLIERAENCRVGMTQYRLSSAGALLVEKLAPIAFARQQIVLGSLPAAAVNAILDALSANVESLIKQQ